MILWWWLFLSPLVRLYMGSPAMDGELGPFDWGFLVLVFFSLPLSLSLSSLSLNLFVLLWKRLKCQKLSSHEISPGAGDVVYHQLL